MMTLASYLSASNTSQAEFALAVGVKQPTVHRWLNGARPSWDTAAKIEKATNGAVPIAVWADHCASPSSVSTTTDSLPSKEIGDAATDIQGDAA
jgi:DNA-binding transcriptional regulator YdaS (Cro superfamily)